MSSEQKIGLFFVLGVVLLFVAVEATIGLGLLRNRYPLWAEFADVQGLDVGADVRLAGIAAGRVRSMRIEGDRVRVEMAIDAGQVVKKDAIARLDFRALSGERYVSITLGSPGAPPAAPGDTIPGETPASFAQAVDSLNAVAESVNDLATNLNDATSRLLGGLADLVDENRRALGTVAQNFASITEKLDRGTGTLGLLLNEPALYDQVTAAMGDVRRSVQDLGRVASDLAEGRGTLGKLVGEDGGLYEQVRETVDDLSATARNAQEITDRLARGEGTLGKALADDGLYTEAQDTLRTVNRATQSVEDQAPISLLGTIVTSLF